MIKWTPDDVASFLGTTAIQPWDEGTELRFGFPTGAATAELRVLPFDESVIVVVWVGSKEEDEIVRMSFNCNRIEVVDEIEEEGGPSLQIRADAGDSTITSGLGIGRGPKGFSIHGVSLRKKS
ncbi:MAG TPA: hypothetical protein VGE67_15505 [Haloferula sp.]